MKDAVCTRIILLFPSLPSNPLTSLKSGKFNDNEVTQVLLSMAKPHVDVMNSLKFPMPLGPFRNYLTNALLADLFNRDLSIKRNVFAHALTRLLLIR